MSKNNKSILEIAESIKERLRYEKDPSALLAYCGRYCRGLLYKGQEQLLANDPEWKSLCLRSFDTNVIDLEFNAAIYTFLRKVHGEKLALDFYHNSRWDNALIESELMLSMAFNEQKTLNNYRQFLGFRI